MDQNCTNEHINVQNEIINLTKNDFKDKVLLIIIIVS